MKTIGGLMIPSQIMMKKNSQKLIIPINKYYYNTLNNIQKQVVINFTNNYW